MKLTLTSARVIAFILSIIVYLSLDLYCKMMSSKNYDISIKLFKFYNFDFILFFIALFCCLMLLSIANFNSNFISIMFIMLCISGTTFYSIRFNAENNPVYKMKYEVVDMDTKNQYVIIENTNPEKSIVMPCKFIKNQLVISKRKYKQMDITGHPITYTILDKVPQFK